MPHRGVVRLVQSPNFIELNDRTVTLLHSPLNFDASTFEVYAPLLNGGTVVVMPAGDLQVEKLRSVIKQYQVNTLWLTAGLFHALTDTAMDLFANLNYLLAGGDVLSPTHVNQVLEHYPHLNLINGYGPTENTTFTCCHPVEHPIAPGEMVSIGRPITGTRVMVLNDQLKPVPVGVEGMLYTSGDGVALGYINQPDLTAEVFVADPLSDQPGERMYKTGDYAAVRPNGQIEFVGRKDTQVKIRGYFFYLGGNSLLALQLLANIANETGVTVSVAQLSSVSDVS